MNNLLLSAASICCVALASASSAATINFDYASGSQSSNGTDLGTSATLDVTFTDVGDDVSLSIIATNTSDVATGGFLTAFGFDMPSIDSVISSVMDAGYSLVEFNGSQVLNEFGGLTLNVGAGTGQTYNSKGQPSGGIGIGSSGTYSFLLDTIETAASLEAAFLAQDENSAVRFKGLDTNPSSDKLTNTTVPMSPVPLPAAGLFLLAGLGAFGAVKRYKH